MTIRTRSLRVLVALVILIGVGASFWFGKSRLRVDNDITAALPEKDEVVAAARRILKHHPALENVFIQISLMGKVTDLETLVEAGDLVVAALGKSGLVKVISGQGGLEYFSVMMHTVTDNLPLFMTEADLEGRVQDMLQPGQLEKLLQDEHRDLFGLTGLGQTEYLSKDPLGLRNLMLSRMSSAMPFQGGTFRRGHIVSKDETKLLIIAEPLASAQDTAFARRITEVLENAIVRLKEVPTPEGTQLKMIYAGAFRAALDNERIIRRDASRTLILVTIGLTIMVLVSFRRPWLGILAMVPAIAGIMLATFVYALMRDSIFAISMGFGGALIAIAVDHGLAYVILLDKAYETKGPQISKEVWSVASLTVLTTIVAFLSLTVLGIPLFTEVGLFAALGVGFAALFVHLFFPTLFYRLKGSGRNNPMPMERLMDWLNASSNWATVVVFSMFALLMLFFVKLQFNVDLTSMNTVAPQTLEAEETIGKTWGNLSNRAYIMATGQTEKALWAEVDRLGDFLKNQKDASVLAAGLPVGTMFPGPKAQQTNLEAWRAFWTPKRISNLSRRLGEIGAKIGFSDSAFQPFLKMVQEPRSDPVAVPVELYLPFGVFPEPESGGWILVDVITPGPAYQAESFFHRAHKARFTVFDLEYFSHHMARELNASFARMLLIIGGIAVFILLFFFMDWQLVLLSLTPLAFSLIATLGTMGILGLPLSIPSLMLAPILVGLGMDYGLYLVRSYQRFGTASHSHARAFRVAVLLGGLSTLIGTGSLSISEHTVLKTAGISTSLGIFYAMIGTFGILPPLLSRLFSPRPSLERKVKPGSKEHGRLVLNRFKHLEPYPRFFAWFKIRLDPMFPRLADFVRSGQTLIDVGCGYGVPAAWLLALYPDLRFIACEPSQERARVAARVLGDSAQVFPVGGLDLPPLENKAHAALLLDMLHYLTEKGLEELLRRLKDMLEDPKRLIIRATILGQKFSFQRWVERAKMRFKNSRPNFRTEEEIIEALNREGFKVELVEPTAPGREETWFIAAVSN
jgi:predicted exporter/SAM-dependent methyltransferase